MKFVNVITYIFKWRNGESCGSLVYHTKRSAVYEKYIDIEKNVKFYTQKKK